MASRTIAYIDSLFYPALIGVINEAKSLIEIATFVFRTYYQSDTRSKAIHDALVAAAERGVKVLIILNYSRFEPDVALQKGVTG